MYFVVPLSSSLYSWPELQLLLPAPLVGLPALRQGAEGGRGDPVHGPRGLRQPQHGHQPVARGYVPPRQPPPTRPPASLGSAECFRCASIIIMWIRFLVPTLFGSGWGGGGVPKNNSKIKSASFHADPALGGIFKFGSVRFRIRIETRESVFCASVVEPVRFCSTLAPDPTPGVQVEFRILFIQFLMLPFLFIIFASMLLSKCFFEGKKQTSWKCSV